MIFSPLDEKHGAKLKKLLVSRYDPRYEPGFSSYASVYLIILSLEYNNENLDMLMHYIKENYPECQIEETGPPRDFFITGLTLKGVYIRKKPF